MKKIIIPTDEHARQAIETAMPCFEISNLSNPVPGVVWTADVQTEHVKASVFVKFSQRSGWFVDTRSQY